MFEKLKYFFTIFSGTFIIAFGVYFLMSPYHIMCGSVTGLAIVLTNFIPVSLSVMTFILNVICIILAFVFIDRAFGVKIILISLLLPAILFVFEVLVPNPQSLTGNIALDAIAMVTVICFGQAMLFNANAASGGLDIIAKMMNKYLHMEVGKAVGLAGMAVALLSILICDLKTVILSVLGTYFGGMILDHFIFGSTIKKRVCIISKKEQEILDFILHELHSGATKYHAYGTYSDAQYIEINTIVDKNEYLQLMNFITKVDPTAFVTVYAVNEMRYVPKDVQK